MSKRFFDITVAAIGLILLFPLFIVLAFLVRRKLGSPVFFRQVRPGRDGRPFTMLKFRTMSTACDEQGRLLPDAQRLTGFGRFLRSTSLDELPELWNVLQGDMSLVGPRPLLMEYLPLYNERQKKRHHLRPGITGWAQIHGRNAISWQEKFELDVFYVEHQSFWLDLKILIVTLVRVLRREGIHASNQATMSKFTGNDPAGQSGES